MNDKTLFMIFFIFIMLSFFNGTDTFYEQFDCFSSLQYDEVTWRLLSLAMASIICAIYWNYYVNNYV